MTMMFKKSNNYSVFYEDFCRNVIKNPKFGVIEFGEDLWGSGDQSNRTWRWYLHSFVFLDAIIDSEDINLLKKIVQSWVDQFLDRSLDDDFPWHDHASSLRLDRISRLKIQLNVDGLSEIAERHAEILLLDDFYSIHTNHGFDQACSLILVSLAFPDSESTSLWKKVGVSRLLNEIEFAFTEEGIHVENSPAYHLGMMKNLLRARDLLEAVNFSLEGVDEIFDKCLCFLAWITRPDGFIPYIGDSERYKPSVPDVLNKLPSSEFVQYVISEGRQGSAPCNKYAVFEKSGYAIYRSKWSPWKDHVQLIIKCGFLSRYHRQDDDLNLLLYAFGEDWFIDSGLYNHNPKDPIRKYMRSNLAHNVPIIEEVSINRLDFGKEFSRVIDLKLADYEFSVEAETNMYIGGKVFRKIMIKNELNFNIEDTFVGFHDKNKKWIFHLPLDKEVLIFDNFVKVVGKSKSLIIKNSEKLKCSVSRGFSKPFPSVFSSKVNLVIDSQVLVFESKNLQNINFDFYFV